ncbi:hypothetical protein ACFLZV_04550 [Candidatus Margulisiibacteriota bacterium]
MQKYKIISVCQRTENVVKKRQSKGFLDHKRSQGTIYKKRTKNYFIDKLKKIRNNSKIKMPQGLSQGMQSFFRFCTKPKFKIQVNDSGSKKTLLQVLKFNESEMELYHQFIQQILPGKKLSPHNERAWLYENGDAPILIEKAPFITEIMHLNIQKLIDHCLHNKIDYINHHNNKRLIRAAGVAKSFQIPLTQEERKFFYDGLPKIDKALNEGVYSKLKNLTAYFQ